MGYTSTNSSIESAAQGIFTLAICRPTVGRLLAKSADSKFWELFFTITQIIIHQV